MKRAFTLIELVFVIVVLGILAGIAAPRLFATRDDAIIAKARSDIASIKSAVVNFRNTNMLQGKFEYPNLEKSSTSGVLFDNVLQGGIKEKPLGAKSGWSKSGDKYKFALNGTEVEFTYDKNSGTFSCDRSKAYCKELTE